MSDPGDVRERMTLRARWVFPVSADPIENGVVELAGREIVAVRPSRSREPGIVDLAHSNYPGAGECTCAPGVQHAGTAARTAVAVCGVDSIGGGVAEKSVR